MSSASPKRPAANKGVPFADGRYLLCHRLGNGSFGDIFEGWDTVLRIRVAVKLEKRKVRFPQLDYESKVYRVLHQPPVGMNEVVPAQDLLDLHDQLNEELATDPSGTPLESNLSTKIPYVVVGIPQIYYFDSEGEYNIMVMELCGPSLEDVFNYCHRRFSLKTVLMIADQLIVRMQYMHERGFAHRDIKPENFVFGTGAKAHILYAIDFGLSKLYWDVKKNVHIPFAEGKPLTGTARYCSANTHRGYEQSRRDDLESIGFLFVYFLKGSLPWQGIQAKDQQLKTIKIGEKKIATSLEDLCKGLPAEFLKYCKYCRALTFQQKPDYDYLRELFHSLARRYGYVLKTPGEKAASSPPVVSATNTATTQGLSKTSSGFVPYGYSECVEPDPRRGFYDWNFDWFQKRELEVDGGIEAENLRRMNAMTSDAQSYNPALHGSVQDIKQYPKEAE